ncbi:hypothetical protein ACFX2I_027015 [Malus domestica]
MANSQFVPACIMFIANIVIVNIGAAIGGWPNGHATFYGGACGYADTNKQGYRVETTAQSSALFNNGQTCGACFEVTCVDDPKWCLQGTIKTAKFAAAGIVPVGFQLVPCFKRGGIKFYLGGRPNFLLVLIHNAGGLLNWSM